jgi:hypothetical protein
MGRRAAIHSRPMQRLSGSNGLHQRHSFPQRCFHPLAPVPARTRGGCTLTRWPRRRVHGGASTCTQTREFAVRAAYVCACACAQCQVRQWLAQHEVLNLGRLAGLAAAKCWHQTTPLAEPFIAIIPYSISPVNPFAISAAIKSRPRAHWRTCTSLAAWTALHDMYFGPADCNAYSALYSTCTLYVRVPCTYV